MNPMLSFLSHDWAGLALAVAVALLGAACLRTGKLRRRSWVVWVGAAVSGVAAVMGVGSIYHVVHMAQVRAQHPAPGKLVDVGGYRLHLLAEGEARGKPTIVWIPGAHSAGFYLHHLHRMLSEDTRSILIDRAGAGWSDIGPFPRTTAVEAEEVVKALQAAGEKGPFIFAGHSLGGLLAANIARRHPDIVTGVVLLDATPPDAIDYAPPNPFLAQMRHQALLATLQRLFGIHQDLAQKLAGREPDPATKQITDLIAQRLGPGLADVRAVEDAARSNTANASIFEELAPGGMGWDNTVYDGDLGDLPVFLVAPQELEEFAAVAKAMSKASGAEGAAAMDAQRLHRFYLRTRERYMASSSQTQRIVAPRGTGHNFPYEAPEFVAEAMRRILAQVSAPQPSGTPAAEQRSGPPADPIEFDLVLQSQIDINAPPSVVWNYLDRIQEWKRSVVSLERVAGARNQVGEVVRIGQRPANETVYVRQQTLQLEPNRWKVQSLTTEDGHTTRGYVIYSLYGAGDSTRVVCDLVARASLPAQAAQGRTAAEISRLASAGTKAKLDADHLALKQLVEGARTR